MRIGRQRVQTIQPDTINTVTVGTTERGAAIALIRQSPPLKFTSSIR